MTLAYRQLGEATGRRSALAGVSCGIRGDAGDELVLDAAVNGGATHLVTFNLGDFGRAPQQFGIRSLRPADMLRLVRSRLA